jgi:hypothetical protein
MRKRIENEVPCQWRAILSCLQTILNESTEAVGLSVPSLLDILRGMKVLPTYPPVKQELSR